MTDDQLDRMSSGAGFIAALDQSGGSTPSALEHYGIARDAYTSDEEMFALMHAMRVRIITNPAFRSERILGAILFEDTLRRPIDSLGSAEYLWTKKHIVPFLKVDKGLAPEVDGARCMNPIPGLDALLATAREQGVFGTKMRSFIHLAEPAGIRAVVDQQFEYGRQILAAGLVPILEPEVDIHSPAKAAAEDLLVQALIERLDELADGERVMLKLTLPERDDCYAQLVGHARVLRVVALSGGYSRQEATARLARVPGVIASFSRALTEGLSVNQSDEEFTAELAGAIEEIYAASRT